MAGFKSRDDSYLALATWKMDGCNNLLIDKAKAIINELHVATQMKAKYILILTDCKGLVNMVTKFNQ